MCGTGDVLRGKWRGKDLAIKVLQVRRGTLSKAETDGLIKSFSREVSLDTRAREEERERRGGPGDWLASGWAV